MAWIGRRVLGAIFVIWLAVTLTFAALRVWGTDALTAELIKGGATQEQIDEQRARLGLDRPAPIQYAEYLIGLVRGDWGRSLLDGRPVLRIIGEQLGATAELAAAALGAAVAFGVGLGVLAAQDRSRILAGAASGLATLALSAPVYWTGTLAITVFAVWLGWLPATSGEGVRFLVLPAGVLGFSLSGSIARVTRANIRETKSQSFVTVAASKGLRGREIWGRHILRAALPPVLSVIGLQLGFLLGGTVITEALFARRGIGGLLVDAILDQNFPVVQGIVVMSAAVYAGTGALTDILHAFADPRLRETPEPEAN